MLDIVTDRTYHSDQDGDVDCRLLEESGLLDVTGYCASAGLEAGADAARHYLLDGWRAGLEPSRGFEGSFLYPYYRSAGLDGPPALTYLMLRAAGWSVYASRQQAQETADVVGSSTLFDAARLQGTCGRSRRPRPGVALRPRGRRNRARTISGLRSRILSTSQSRSVRRPRSTGSITTSLTAARKGGAASASLRRWPSIGNVWMRRARRFCSSPTMRLVPARRSSRTTSHCGCSRNTTSSPCCSAPANCSRCSRAAALPWSDRSLTPSGARRKRGIW